MDQSTIEGIISQSVKKAIKEYDESQRIDKKKKALHNTKLLLKNYHKIKQSIELAVDELNEDIESSGMDFTNLTDIDGDRIYIDSIRRSRARSLIIISHIDNALEVMKVEKEKQNFSDKFKVFKSCTFDGVSYEDAANRYNTSVASVSRWIKELTREMSIYLFGIDGVNSL